HVEGHREESTDGEAAAGNARLGATSLQRAAVGAVCDRAKKGTLTERPLPNALQRCADEVPGSCGLALLETAESVQGAGGPNRAASGPGESIGRNHAVADRLVEDLRGFVGSDSRYGTGPAFRQRIECEVRN